MLILFYKSAQFKQIFIIIYTKHQIKLMLNNFYKKYVLN